MRRRSSTAAAVLCGVALVVGLPRAALAGGVDQILFDTDYHVAGSSGTGRGELAFASARRARRQLRRGALSVYLVPAADIRPGGAEGDDWWTGPPPSARKVGRASLRPGAWSDSVLDVRAAVTVPATLIPDDYSLVLCRGSCRRLTGMYQWPSPFTVVGSLAEARLLQRLDRLGGETSVSLNDVRQQLDGTSERLATVQQRSRASSLEVLEATAALREDVAAAATRLDAELARTRRHQGDAEAAAKAERRLGTATIALLLVALLGLLRRQRPLPAVSGGADGFEPALPAGASRRR